MLEIKANDPKLQSFIKVDKDSHFPIQNLPLGVFSDIEEDFSRRRIGVAIGDYILDLKAAYECKLLPDFGLNFSQLNNLNPLIEHGRSKVRTLREVVSHLLNKNTSTLRDDVVLQKKVLIKQSNAKLYLPIEIKGYTDFYSSREHAENIGRMFRDKDNPLLPNWLHLPVGYDGRAGSVVVSGTMIQRPNGQIKPSSNEPPIFSASQALDVEIEMGAIIGLSSKHGQVIDIKNAPEHIVGMVLVNDWSARDIQKWEYVPLGPFLAKNFATSISPWIVTLDALEPFRVPSPKEELKLLGYLKRSEDWGININLQFAIKTPKSQTAQIVSRTNFKYMYWDMMQQLAHHTVNGCPMATGDLLASGTISGKEKDSFGSLIELTEGGKNPLQLKTGETRIFLQDGDIAIISGFCQGQGYKIGFGEVLGEIVSMSTKFKEGNVQRKTVDENAK
ncbi:fumarylacetoacetase [Fastidiosibacter lacustris]|uniref:fumarylacetoacetase n=1 Tax=Fastidiosibacter lacustris TaxID=2056695 RepID=UPI001864668E|nr:fumarylacetoacetase [Fastidiosibacter lacustris]